MKKTGPPRRQRSVRSCWHYSSGWWKSKRGSSQTSRTSSKPPSSDPPGTAPRRAKDPAGRKPGGQPGHTGHGRTLKPETEVDQILDGRAEQGGQGGTLLWGEDPEAGRQQGTEVPRITPVGTEYRRQRLSCGACGARTPAPWPATMALGSFGSRVQATGGVFDGTEGCQSAGGARNSGAEVSTGGKCRQGGGVGTGGECGVSCAGGGGRHGRAASAGAPCG